MWIVTKKLVPVDIPIGRLSAKNEEGHELNIELPSDILKTIKVGDQLKLTIERAE